MHFFLFWKNGITPCMETCIFNLGMVPNILAEYPENYHPYFSNSTWSNLKLISFIAGVDILLWFWYRFSQTLFFLVKREPEKVNWAITFSLTTAGIYFLFLITNDFFDQYYLIPLPFFGFNYFSKKP
jgi:hypothetical protein